MIMKNINIPKLLISIFTPLLAGFLGSYFTTPNIPTWYASLQKPFFSPPNWLFGPVWTILYLLMGISFYLIWNSSNSKANLSAIRLFIAQLVLNSLWSILFFGIKNPLLAFLEIIILWIFIFLTIKKFSQINQAASYLLYPYLAWVTFASFLNFAIVLLN